MNCDRFRDQVFDWLAGALADAGPFRAHRAACAACAALVAGIEENERLLRGARVPAAPADLWPRIAARLAASAPARRLRFAPIVAAAAALLLAIGAARLVGPPVPAPRLAVTFVDAKGETAGSFRAFLPRYEDADVLALGD